MKEYFILYIKKITDIMLGKVSDNFELPWLSVNLVY